MNLILLRLISEFCFLFRGIPCNIFPIGPQEFGDSLKRLSEDGQIIQAYIQDSYALPEKFKNGNYYMIFKGQMYLWHPKMFRQSTIFPPLKMPYGQFLISPAENFTEKLQLHRVDKLTLTAKHRVILLYGGFKLPYKDLFRRKDILASLFFLNANNELYRYCNRWQLTNRWSTSKGQFIKKLSLPTTCLTSDKLTFFVGNWRLGAMEEVFLLLLVSEAVKMKLTITFPFYKCNNFVFRSLRYSPFAYENSYIDPIKRVNLNNLPFTYRFKKPNLLKGNTLVYKLTSLDIVGGSIILNEFLRLNSFLDFFPYVMTLSFYNQAKYPVVRQPHSIARGVKYFSAFDVSTWALIVIALAVLFSLGTMTLEVYRQYMPEIWLQRNKGTKVIIFLRLTFGLVHPPECNWFKRPFSSGAIFILTWCLLSMFVLIFYNNDLRSALIGQTFEDPIEDINEEDPLSTLIVMTGSKYNNLFMDHGFSTMHTLLRHALAVRNVSPIIASNSLGQNLNEMEHHVLDIIYNKRNSLIPLTEIEYRLVAKMYQTNRKESPLLRQSPIPIPSMIRGLDGVWFLPKHFPHTEEIDMAIKVIYQMGVLWHFTVHLPQNPKGINPHKWSQADEAQQIIHLGLLGNMFQFLSVSLTMIILVFLYERSFNTFAIRKRKKWSQWADMQKRISSHTTSCTLSIAIIVVVISTITIVKLGNKKLAIIEKSPEFTFAIGESIREIHGADFFNVYSESKSCQTVVWNQLTGLYQQRMHKIFGEMITRRYPLYLFHSSISVTSKFILTFNFKSNFYLFYTENIDNYYAHSRNTQNRLLPTLVHMSQLNFLWVTGGFRDRRGTFKDFRATKTTAILNLKSYHYEFSGPEMPLPLARHCAVAIDMFRVFIFGGIIDEILDTNSTNLAYNEHGFIYDFHFESWISISTANPCGKLDPIPKLYCEMRNETEEVIIPGRIVDNESPCTAIFNTKSRTWSTLRRDVRKWPVAGRLLHANGIMYHLGGLDLFTNKGTNQVYELVGKSHWKLRQDIVLPVALGGNEPFVPMSSEYCTGNKTFYNKGFILTKKMLYLEPEGAKAPNKPDYVVKTIEKMKKSINEGIDGTNQTYRQIIQTTEYCERNINDFLQVIEDLRQDG